jgi:cytochrome c2
MPEKEAAIIADYLEMAMLSPAVDTTFDRKQFTPAMAAAGKELYEKKYQCQSCHTIGSAGGYVGPSLGNAGDWLTQGWIEAWLRNPQELVPGTIEPRQAFTPEEIQDLTAYLLTLKQSGSARGSVGASSAGGTR